MSSRGASSVAFEKGVSLAPLTSFRLGGPARLFARAASEPQAAEVLRRASKEGLAVRLLGGGTNILVADGGVDGLVVKLEGAGLAEAEVEGRILRAGGAARTTSLVALAASSGLSGLEPLAGLPGTVGGAVRGNSGGRAGCIGPLVRSVRALTDGGELRVLGRGELEFSYRRSSVEGMLVTGVELELSESDGAAVRERTRESIEERWAKQPRGVRSAGCVFKNPAEGEGAGKLIDGLGLKGASVRGAAVSEVHANFIVAREGAASADVLELIELIRRRVREERGLELELEIEVWR